MKFVNIIFLYISFILTFFSYSNAKVYTLEQKITETGENYIEFKISNDLVVTDWSSNQNWEFINSPDGFSAIFKAHCIGKGFYKKTDAKEFKIIRGLCHALDKDEDLLITETEWKPSNSNTGKWKILCGTGKFQGMKGGGTFIYEQTFDGNSKSMESNSFVSINEYAPGGEEC
tara:strand:- start:171 stop:689 length:519 start_codon:yes stop_codon:yes gene_type:complete